MHLGKPCGGVADGGRSADRSACCGAQAWWGEELLIEHELARVRVVGQRAYPLAELEIPGTGREVLAEGKTAGQQAV